MKKIVIITWIIIALLFPGILMLLCIAGEEQGNIEANPNLDTDQLNFIAQILPGAMDGLKDGIFPSVTLAQAILESGWGKSGLAIKANNLFGIKADSSWSGEVLEMLTQEEVNGGMITTVARWRVYKDWNESVIDHNKFLLENSRYKENGVFEAPNYVEQAQALQKAGYATNSDYAEKLIQVINTYALNLYDLKISDEDKNEIIEKAIESGMSIVGKSPYVWGGGRTPEDIEARRFDCSSFVHWCYSEAGLELGDYRSVVTGTLVNMGISVDTSEMKRGDLIFFDSNGVNGHVGIYLGENLFINDSTSKGVSVASLDNPYWKNYFNGVVRRVVN